MMKRKMREMFVRQLDFVWLLGSLRERCFSLEASIQARRKEKTQLAFSFPLNAVACFLL